MRRRTERRTERHAERGTERCTERRGTHAAHAARVVVAAVVAAVVCAVAPLAAAQADSAATAPAVQEASADVLASFVAGIDAHPALRAALAALAAAEADAGAARSPVNVDGSYTRVWLQGVEQPPAPSPAIPTEGYRLTVDASLRLFPFGDIADLTDQRDIEVVRARLAAREARAQLEAQALESAAGLIVAEQARALAEQGVDLARSALEITRLRADRGGASARDVERAERDLLRAEQQRDASLRRLDLARAGLAQLVGDARLDGLPAPEAFPAASGPAADVVRARLDARLADVGARSATRELLPVAQASYSAPFGPDGGTVSASIESRTLQPTLSYIYNDGAAALEAGTSGDVGQFRIGVSLRLSPETFAARDAAAARVRAAQANLDQREAQALLAAAQRDADLAAARDAYALAQHDVDLARGDLDDALERRDLGLATDLDVRRSRLDLGNAELARSQAHLDLLRALLATYRATATPPSEVLP